MVNLSSNYHGILLVWFMFIMMIGLFTVDPSITGFSVKEVKEYSQFDVEVYGNEYRTCADGSLYGECSSLIQPKFCLYGKLVDYCELCGCDAGKVCQNRECVGVE